MDSPGIKFGDLKKDERYKRLERRLKLEFVKKMEQVRTDGGYCTSPTWPSLSSINADGMDTTSANGVPSLQVSGVESEVVASSSNFRKAPPMHKLGVFKRQPMATSSVKQFPLDNHDNDRAIMPPPPTSNLIFHNAKKQSSNDGKQQSNEQNQQHKNTEPDSEVSNFPIKMPSVVSSATQQENSSNNELIFDSEDLRKHIFSRWRVLLSKQGQLVIKGTLECGKIARSKPVLQRITSTKVQSIHKHIYLLDGNIVDDRNELPDYVKGKFYNGFPDDWENVYQLWRNYVAEGAKVTFRWPTPITDSDDDLYSEVTDFTYIPNKQIASNKQAYFPKTSSNSGSSLGYHSKDQSDSNQNLEKSKEETVENATPKTQTVNKENAESSHLLEVKDVSACSVEGSTENNSKDNHSTNANSSSSNLKNINYLYEIIREDKLRIILSNLGNKNCPLQYLDKFIELIDCLRYVLSYTSSNNHDSNSRIQQSPSKNQSLGCQKCNNTASFSETQETIPDEKSNNVQSKKECDNTEESGESEEQKENDKKSKISNSKDNDVENNLSDSDTYMGIPHVKSLNALIKSKVPRSERYRGRKNRSKDSKNVSKDKEDEEQESANEQEFQNHYDSSVSITEDEFERRNQRKKYKRFDEQVPRTAIKNAVKNSAMENVKQDNIKNGHTNEIENVHTTKTSESKLPMTPIKSMQEAKENQKPVIKSCEAVYIDLKKGPLKSHNRNTDASNTDEQITKKKQKLSNPPSNSANDKKLCEELLVHPFLTYDSEDFLDEEEADVEIKLLSNKENNSEASEKCKTENKKGSESLPSKKLAKHNKVEEQDLQSTEKRKASSNDKVTATEAFGSKENPKFLASWIPCVIYDDELKKHSLTFEGKLLNEAGHILHRKFSTGFIRQRHSPKLLETVNNEFFLLTGEINDTKHVIPKELLKQCRTGCPAKIKEFCEGWKRLKPEKTTLNKSTNLNDVSIDVNITTSSRGRRILPPLNYWNGERILTKDNEILYDPGNVDEAVLMKKSEIPKKSVPSSEQRPQRNSSTKKEVNARVSRTTAKSSKVEDKPPSPDIRQEKKPQARKRIALQLQYPSSSDSDANETQNKRNLRKPKPPINRNKTADAQSERRKSNQPPNNQITNTKSECMNSPRTQKISSKQACDIKIQKKQRLDAKENLQQNSEPSNTKSRVPQKNFPPDVMWTYEKGQQYHDILSDDQISVIVK